MGNFEIKRIAGVGHIIPADNEHFHAKFVADFIDLHSKAEGNLEIDIEEENFNLN